MGHGACIKEINLYIFETDYNSPYLKGSRKLKSSDELA